MFRIKSLIFKVVEIVDFQKGWNQLAQKLKMDRVPPKLGVVRLGANSVETVP